jgi:hypothetical protein
VRAVLLASVVLTLSGCGSDAASGPGAPVGLPRPKASQPSVAGTRQTPRRPRPGERFGAAIVRRTAVRAAPSASSRVLFRVPTRTRFGSPSVMAVMRQRGRWLGVAWPDLANGKLGWIRRGAVKLLRELWAIDVDLSKRQAVLSHQGKPYRSFAVAVGAPAYATPTGRFGVTDRLSTGGAGSPYGCCVLALTGHQPDVAQDWPGGDRIAIHGTDDPASVGTAVSHGCLRTSEPTMRLLIAKVPLGTPVVIHA